MMTEYIDIAASLHTKSLTIFVGTGFSKYMTNGKAPSWLELMAELTTKIDKGNVLLNQLFNVNEDGDVKEAVYELTVIAQILEAEYKREKKDIKSTAAQIINETVNESTIDKDKLSKMVAFFSKYPTVNIVTTNYDTLFSHFILPESSRVFVEGGPIMRLNSHQNIFHIHGCTTIPKSIVLTLNDYYNFQNSQNYFARKFFTLLQETTVCLLGYSLGDFNLNTILSEVKNNKNESFRRNDIYYISRGPVPDIIDRFYSFTYGINSIQHTEIYNFFEEIEKSYPEAETILDSVKDLKGVLKGELVYTDSFLQLRMSLSKILLQASNAGIDVRDDRFLEILLIILKKKKEFCALSQRWEQYDHLADWLIEIASCVQIAGSKIEKEFLELVTYSLNHSSRELYKGFSWQAWKEWKYRWNEMLIENQLLFKELIESGSWNSLSEIKKILD